MKTLLSAIFALALFAVSSMTSTASTSPRISATVKLSCNHDGSMNIEPVPLNHQ